VNVSVSMKVIHDTESVVTKVVFLFNLIFKAVKFCEAFRLTFNIDIKKKSCPEQNKSNLKSVLLL